MGRWASTGTAETSGALSYLDDASWWRSMYAHGCLTAAERVSSVISSMRHRAKLLPFYLGLAIQASPRSIVNTRRSAHTSQSRSGFRLKRYEVVQTANAPNSLAWTRPRHM